MKSKIVSGLSVLLLEVTILAANEPAIIPQPQNLTPFEGSFMLLSDTRTYTDRASMDTGEMQAGQLRKSVGGPFHIIGKAAPDLSGMITDGVLLTTQNADAGLGAEGYELSVATNRIVLRPPTQAGLFYGVQTLLQLLPATIFSRYRARNEIGNAYSLVAQAAGALKESILAGVWVGTLPGEHELCGHLHVSRVTLRKDLYELQ